jgi:hypothetical protein
VAAFINGASSGLVLVAFGTMPVVGSALTATGEDGGVVLCVRQRQVHAHMELKMLCSL